METEAKIREFILDNFLFTDDPDSLSNEASFLDKGIVDSTGMLEIINFIEDECDIKVEDEEMIPENLDSVNSIIAYLKKKSC